PPPHGSIQVKVIILKIFIMHIDKSRKIARKSIFLRRVAVNNPQQNCQN
ncbi:hypothetical protein HMPREF1584_00886, partial [Gardnerella vaginalis JCP8481A]